MVSNGKNAKDFGGNSYIDRSAVDNGKFGYWRFTPSWLQFLNNQWCFLVGIVGLTLGQSLAVVGILATVMPQIEKRFNYSSFDIGMIAAANDVACVLLGLVISHYGNFGNKVKWIGVGGIITGTGFVIFALPHFIIGKYDPPTVSTPSFLCTPKSPVNTRSSSNVTTDSKGCNEGSIAGWYHLALMLIGQFVAGLGSISLYSFTPACFQESVSAKNIPLFLGIWQGSVIAGPLIAFAFAEPLLELYVDIHEPDKMTPKDPRWIGNWWLGVLGAAAFCYLSALFILGFPSKIKSRKSPPSTDQGNETLVDTPIRPTTVREKLKEFPSVLKKTLTNWTFVCNSMGVNCTLMYGEGLAPFVAKVLTSRFGVAPEKVGTAMTICAAPPLLIGVLVGSFATRAFSLEKSGRKSALFCFICQVFVILGPMAFLLPGCNEINLAGWQVPYRARSGKGRTNNLTDYPAIHGVQLDSTCNQNCSCHLGIALQVCGSDYITYLSPCYAGCTGVISGTKFGNCSCIPSDNEFGGTAEVGYCDQDCKNWVVFLLMMGAVTLVFCLQLAPSKNVLMRCLPPKDLAFAFGLQYLSTKVFAHIPGPILFGHVVDFNCVIWQKVCNKTGFCWVYDMDEQMKMISTIAGILSGLGMLFFLLSWILYKEPEAENKKPQYTLKNPIYGQDIKDTSL